MSSLPTTKRAKTGGRGNAHDTNENEKLLPHARINVIAQLVDMDGNNAGPQLDLPHDCTSKQLEELLNTLLNNTEEKGEKLPYEFYIKDETLTTDLGDHLANVNASMEQVLKIVYAPQALFRVRPVTRCSSALQAIWYTAPTCPRKVHTKSPVSPFHNFTALSNDAEAKYLPSGENMT